MSKLFKCLPQTVQPWSLHGDIVRKFARLKLWITSRIDSFLVEVNVRAGRLILGVALRVFVLTAGELGRLNAGGESTHR